MQRPPRIRKNRMNGEKVKRTFELRADIDEGLAEVARRDFRNNKTAALEQAAIEFLNRRRDPRAA
jgi:hypothetical protein